MMTRSLEDLQKWDFSTDLINQPLPETLKNDLNFFPWGELWREKRIRLLKTTYVISLPPPIIGLFDFNASVFGWF